MARSGWLTDNEHRAYPFLDAPTGIPLPESAVVDFGCVVGPDSLFSSDAVYLYRVARSGGVFSFEFRSTAAGLAGSPLTFYVPDDSPEFSGFEAGSGSFVSGSSQSSECGDVPLWEGYLVVGDLDDLRNLLGDGDDMVADEENLGAAEVEPARVQDLGRTFVRSVNLANGDRTRAEPDETGSLSSPGPVETFVYARCLTGALKIRPGFNASIRQGSADNSLTVGAAVGAGAGEPCSEVPVYPGETPLDGETLLTGGPSCGEVLKSVNGVGGRTVRLSAGPGVSVSPGAGEGQLAVSVDMRGLAVCRTSSIAL